MIMTTVLLCVCMVIITLALVKLRRCDLYCTCPKKLAACEQSPRQDKALPCRVNNGDDERCECRQGANFLPSVIYRKIRVLKCDVIILQTFLIVRYITAAVRTWAKFQIPSLNESEDRDVTYILYLPIPKGAFQGKC